MRKRGLLLAAVTMLVSMQAAPALAHAERIGSTPKEKAKVRSAPGSLRIQFSEPPIGDARFVVLDGCERDLVEDIEVSQMEIDATLAQGQPGRWQVETRVVSGVDGHATSDRWSFTVAGTADCSQTPPPGASNEQDGDDEADGEGGGGSLLLIFAAATLGVIVLALVLRGRGSKP